MAFTYSVSPRENASALTRLRGQYRAAQTRKLMQDLSSLRRRLGWRRYVAQSASVDKEAPFTPLWRDRL
jgi:hypothetical protein